MEKLEYWDKLKRPPKDALKAITGGRMSGKTDINPQWRYKAMTEVFGPVGFGWAFQIDKQWTEPGASGETLAFCNVSVRVKSESGEWSEPVPGTGGSTLIQSEKSGLHSKDETFKMAFTDALSVALKMFGVAADIYAGLWDGAKYKTDAPDQKQPAPQAASMTLEQAKNTKDHNGELYDNKPTEDLSYIANNQKAPAEKRAAAALIIISRNQKQEQK